MARRITNASTTPGAGATSAVVTVTAPAGFTSAKIVGFTLSRAAGGTATEVQIGDNTGNVFYQDFTFAAASLYMQADLNNPIPLPDGFTTIDFVVTCSATAAAAITVIVDWEFLT